MSNIETQSNQCVQAFVAERSELIRRPLSMPFPVLSAPDRSARAQRAECAGRSSRKRRQARCVDDGANQSGPAIGKSIGIATRDLALPVRKLLAEKTIRRRGHKRATKYFPA